MVCIGFPNLNIALPNIFNIGISYANNFEIPGSIFPIPANAIPCCTYSIPSYTIPVSFSIIPNAVLLAIIPAINAEIAAGLALMRKIQIPTCKF